MPQLSLIHGDCLDILPTIPDATIDAVITDPIYPEIDRAYGRMTEVEWHDLMHGVVAECRRVLKPHGSAVFTLQPNYERIGRTRPWPWEFMAWAASEWDVIEDVYWWNTTSLPNAGCERKNGLLRRSVKTCVWLGDPDAYRDQDAVLWGETEWNVEARARERAARETFPSGDGSSRVRIGQAAAERGGVTPYNLIPIPANGCKDDYGHNHPARTPFLVCDWWVRYLTRPGDTILDPFSGSGTVSMAAIARGRDAIGVEKSANYHRIATARLAGKVPA